MLTMYIVPIKSIDEGVNFMRNIKLTALMAAVAMSLSFGVVGVSSAQPSPNVGEIITPTARVLSTEEVEAQMTPERVWGTEFNLFTTWLEETHPGQKAYSRVDEANFTAEIGFKSSVPADVQDKINALSHPITVVTDKGYSQSEVAQEMEKRYYQMREDLGNQISETAATVDFKNASIEFIINPKGSSVPNYDGMRLTKKVERDSAASPIDDKFSFSVHMDKNLKATKEVVYGGDKTSRPGYKYPYCTLGFSVRGHGVENAILTAAHCVHNGVKHSDGSTLTPLGTHSSRDVGWYSSTQGTSNRFYSGSHLVTASNVVSPEVGKTYCFTGAKSGQKCDAVLAVEQCSGQYCGLTMTHHHYSQGGDSGAPWYDGTHPVGIHQGTIPLYGYSRSLFTPAAAAQVVLDVSIK